MTALAKIGGLAPQSIDEAKGLATALAGSGMVPRHIRGPADMLLVLMAGAEMGMGPIQAMRSIHVVDGKVCLTADAILAHLIRGGVRPQWLETTGTKAVLQLTRDGFEPHVHTFTIEEARQAGLAGKDNWRKYPQAMLRARCISAAARAYAPDLANGLYEMDEAVEISAVDVTPQPNDEQETVTRQAAQAQSQREQSRAQRDEWAEELERLADHEDNQDVLARWCYDNGPTLMDMHPNDRQWVDRRLYKSAKRLGVHRSKLNDWLAGRVVDAVIESEVTRGPEAPGEYDAFFAELSGSVGVPGPSTKAELEGFCRAWSADLKRMSDAEKQRAWGPLRDAAGELEVHTSDVRKWIEEGQVEK